LAAVKCVGLDRWRQLKPLARSVAEHAGLKVVRVLLRVVTIEQSGKASANLEAVPFGVAVGLQGLGYTTVLRNDDEHGCVHACFLQELV